MTDWIETRARTPPPLDDVLVVDDFDGEPGVVMAYMDRAGHWFASDSHTPEITPPSHWMPLPELPPGRRFAPHLPTQE